MTSMNRIFLISLSGLISIGCASTKKKLTRIADTALTSPFYDSQFTGLMVLDADTNDTIYARNSQKFFTPASNAKIFTLYAALQFLPQTIPALKYVNQNDTLYIEGTGDPSFLHPFLRDSTALKFLRRHNNISLNLNNYDGDVFGPGWSWGDYQYYYQPEISPFPMYGNVVSVFNSKGVHVSPSYFKDSVISTSFTKQRDLDRNLFYFGKSSRDTTEIPYKTDSTLTRLLLEDILGKNVRITDQTPSGKKNILYGISSDTLYRRMMHESDNMIAEQLLLLVSATLSDTLNSQKVRDSVLSNQLSDLKQLPRWVDGSGLSRYNLFTPEAIVHVLRKLYQENSRERLFTLFPAGGVSGTLEHWYSGENEPYVYAKSGSLSNNYCLSGFLITKSGKILIFSFMNNHFRTPTSQIKKRIQNVLKDFRDNY